jgi:hypothetical protein
MANEIEDDDIRPPPHYREEGPPQVITADTARQAPSGRRVLVMLLGSLFAVAVAWAAIALFFGR